MTTAPKERLNLDGSQGGDGWADVPRMFRELNSTLPAPWAELFGPLRQGLKDDLVVVGQFGQSIDARIATQLNEAKRILHVEDDLIVQPADAPETNLRAARAS